MIEFICGLFIGSFISVAFMAMLQVAKKEDEENEKQMKE